MSSKQRYGLVLVGLTGLLFLALLGYNLGTGSKPAPSAPHGHHGGHAVAVSGGLGIEMELTLDEKSRRMIVYVQDSDTHEPYPLSVNRLDAKFEGDDRVYDVSFDADPRASDPQGSSSRFALSLDKLPQQLIATNQFLLGLSCTIDGGTIDATISHVNDHAHEYHHD